MGATVWTHFMQWVSQEQVGGRDWVSRHVSTFVSLAGSLLGAPKAFAAALSGEASDTVGLDAVSKYVKDQFLPPEVSRADRVVPARCSRVVCGRTPLSPIF